MQTTISTDTAYLDQDELHRTLAEILANNPTLVWCGFWDNYDAQTRPTGSFERYRNETLAAHGLAQFRRALMFLSVAPRMPEINRNRGTYGFKHIAERWFRATVDGHADYYVGEGAFIAACIASGLVIPTVFTHSTY